MEFLQVLDAPVEPGRLVEWVPRVEGGLGSWHRDGRSPSHNHEQHLRAAFEHRARTRREGGRESWLGLSIDFDEPLSVPSLRTAMLGWINRHEVLRTHVVLKHDRTERYSTQPGTVRLKMSRIGWYSDIDLLLEQVAGSFDRATAPLHWPAYRFATVARRTSFTLLFAADHSLVDGYSLVTAQYELTELYRSARDRRPHDLPPTGSYIDFSAAERTRADTADASHRAVQTWREFLAEHGDVPRFVPLVPPADDSDDPFDVEHPPQSSHSGRLLDAAQTAALDVASATAGGNIVSAVLAALALAYRSAAPESEFACVMPRHTRTDPAWEHALGWFVGLAPVVVDVRDDPDFDTAVQRAAEGLVTGRHGARLPFLRVAELLGHTPAPRFVVSYMDARGTPSSASADDGGARVLRSHSYSGDEVYIWVNRTTSGLRMHSRYPAEQPGPVLKFLDDFAGLLASTSAAM
ncbi:condensation domain-containing protein [Gordonia zhaorongruii]|uniref:condensation domain-containing protein n=1 Tax=Gordonia zhaorongruii TaxID=2597659 RepID=UPI00104D2487|nr:condensation domain-containing protein [Gordonia zhaorongruii]